METGENGENGGAGENQGVRNLDLEEGVRRLQALHEEIWGRNHMAYDDALADREFAVAISLSYCIIDSILNLPLSAREFYLSEFGLSARTLLERGLAERDIGSLLRTAQLYPLAETAPLALLAAGDLCFELNEVTRAAAIWDLVPRFARGSTAWSESYAVRKALVAGRQGSTRERNEIVAELARFGRTIPMEVTPARSDENGTLPALPFSRGRLEWRTFSYLKENHILRSYNRAEPAVRFAAVPTFGEGWVATATSRKLLRFNVDSGKQIGDVSLSPESDFSEKQPLIKFYTDSEGDLLVTSYVAGMSDADEYLGYDITVEIPKRGLKGIRIGSDRTVWDTVRRQTEDPFLAQLSFNGRFEVDSDRVYALGWRKMGYIDVFLVCLDLHTGKRIWSAPLVGNQVELTMFGEAAYEPILGDVILEGDAIFCSTNLGVVARVRASDGHVVWATEYEALEKRSRRGRHTRGLPKSMRPTWERNSMLLHRGRLITTPLDSSKLYVIDPESGRVLQDRSGGGFMVGIWEDFLVLVSNPTVQLFPVLDVEQKSNLSWRIGDIRARPALTREGLVYTTDSGLFFLRLQGASTPEKICELGALTDAHNRRREESILDGMVTILKDRILVTSSQRISCYLKDEPAAEVRHR